MPSPFVSRIHPRATAFALLLAAASAVGACSSDSSVESGSEAGADSGPGTAPRDASLDSDAATSDGAVDGGDGAVGDDDADADAALPFLNPHFAFSGPVNAFLPAGHSWYVGGNFTRISKYAASNLIALDPTGAPPGCVSANGFDAGINAIAQSGGSVYIGGTFTHYRGSSANFIAKLDAATCAIDTTFSPPANNGFDDFVTSLVVTNGSLYVGGSFSDYRGASAINIAKLDLTTGALDTTFSPLANNGFSDTVTSLGVSGSALYVGGYFSAYRGVSGSASKVAKLDLTTGALDTTFSPPGAASNGFDGSVDTLAFANCSLYVGGAFTAYPGAITSAEAIAKLDATSGALDTTFSPSGATANGFDGTVTALGVSSTTLLCGGTFTAYRGVAASAEALAVLDPATGSVR
jgi:hypothetical protein